MSVLNLTFIPTFSCNLGCKYCYQNGLENKVVSQENLEIFIDFVKNRLKNFKSKTFHLSWFGGEPLLVRDLVLETNMELQKYCKQKKIKFSSSIATNLTTIDEELCKKLKKLSVKRIETTLAGTEKIHNELRPYQGLKNNSYFDTIKGIEVASKYFPVIINVNLCEENKKTIKLMIKKIKHLAKEKVYLNFNEIINCPQNRGQIKELNNCEKVKLDLFKFAIKNKVKICDITNFCKEHIFCPCWHQNSFAVDYNLNIYKCTDEFNEDTQIGVIDKKTANIKFKKTGIMDNKISSDCIGCQYLPYCNGGCKVKRQQKGSPCPTELASLGKYLYMFVQRENSLNGHGD
jgi:uncharacterized protein